MTSQADCKFCGPTDLDEKGCCEVCGCSISGDGDTNRQEHFHVKGGMTYRCWDCDPAFQSS